MINKKILLGVCGGVAAYKSAELVRLLKKRGADVRVVMTGSALQFVTPLTFQALSGHPVHTTLLDAGQEQAMSHIHLARWADILVIAPVTANTLAKLANGLADDLLSTLYLAAECPVLIAPAMNQAMWRKAVTCENAARLQRHGVEFIGPEAGEQACGELGLGRMAEPETICARLLAGLQPGLLQGVRITITAGPTREPLDPVRFISNRSSGKMGYALALAAIDAGADVTLISGPVCLPAPAGSRLVMVETAQQMYDAVMAGIAQAEIFIGAAAVADYRPVQAQARKIKKGSDAGSIELQKNPDIIASVASLLSRPFTVGFAAETDDLEAYAIGKLRSKNLHMIAANRVGGMEGGFDSDRNALQVFWPDGRQTLSMTDKPHLARQLLELIAGQFHGQNASGANGRPRA
ncbi:MAG: bifunctional phosphopantothenoylcysteine decarboxylase/phosphopantothenate--cysteine ligase CoaBC [Methylococcales bacterium]|nr:bifunctional phosphopantothenoylcysteine decarboxylase/phosphopantothenate--cysteine ligase CoaBC [Methylococcales bacterium]